MTIEHNIPLPTRRYKKPKYSDIVAQMDVGDSVLFATLREANAFACGLNNQGHKSSRRRVENGFRVWLKLKAGVN